MKEIKEIYDTHKVKLNNLKVNLSRAEMDRLPDVDIQSIEAQIRILAPILSDLHKLITK